MVLARWQRPIQDAAGDIVLAGQCEVRREDVAGTPLAVLYSDRDGTTPLGNPFSFADGLPAFHAAGGSYKVRVYGTGFDDTYRYQGVGTGSEVDTDSLLIPGFLFEFETALTEPPTTGCIRANNSDLSLANRLYVSKLTIAGVNVASVIAAMATKTILLTSTDRGVQTQYYVNSVTDDTTHYELAVSSHVGGTAIAAGRVGLQLQGAQGAPGASGAVIGTEAVFTTASNAIGTAEAGKTLIANRATAIAFNLDPAATLGGTWMAVIKNIGVGSLTIDPNGAELIDGASTYVMLPGESALVTCNGSAFRTSLKELALDADLLALASTGMAAFSGLLYGLTLSNNVADAVNDIDVAAGIAIDGSGAKFMSLAAGLTKRLDAAWAVGSGNGGLDTGAIANTTYHVWLILRSDTGVRDVLFSTSATSPTMPANYDYKRRIGSIVRSGGAILAFVQNGDRFDLSVPISNGSANNPGTSAVSATTSVPSGIAVEAILAFGIYANNTAGNTNYFGLLTSLAQADTAPSATLRTISTTDDDDGNTQTVVQNVMTNTSGQVRYRLSASNTGVDVILTTLGWFDRRGRLAA